MIFNEEQIQYKLSFDNFCEQIWGEQECSLSSSNASIVAPPKLTFALLCAPFHHYYVGDRFVGDDLQVRICGTFAKLMIFVVCVF